MEFNPNDWPSEEAELMAAHIEASKLRDAAYEEWLRLAGVARAKFAELEAFRERRKNDPR